jgi:hypothetical protein
MIKILLYFCGPLNLKPQTNHVKKKKIRQIKIEGYSTKYLTSTLQNSQGQQK